MQGLTFRNVLSGNQATNTSVATTASFTPTGNRLYLLTLASRTSTSVNPPIPTVTGNGITYTTVTSVIYDTGVTTLKRLVAYTGIAVSPTAGSITMNYNGTTQT